MAAAAPAPGSRLRPAPAAGSRLRPAPAPEPEPEPRYPLRILSQMQDALLPEWQERLTSLIRNVRSCISHAERRRILPAPGKAAEPRRKLPNVAECCGNPPNLARPSRLTECRATSPQTANHKPQTAGIRVAITQLDRVRRTSPGAPACDSRSSAGRSRALRPS